MPDERWYTWHIQQAEEKVEHLGRLMDDALARTRELAQSHGATLPPPAAAAVAEPGAGPAPEESSILLERLAGLEAKLEQLDEALNQLAGSRR
ncbi:MAG: hypothetical protein HY329_07535 [Chloroflexi bacterium]|nr:hypothetical protein [Chloroflexota bacterium]